MGEVNPKDNDAVTVALDILNKAGFTVSKVRDTESHEDGVKFRIDVVAPSNYKWFDEKTEAVKEQVETVDAPNSGFGSK